MLCPRCNTGNPDEAATCASCGAELTAPAADSQAPWLSAPPPPQEPKPSPPPRPARTSGLAIASLILGFLGFFSLGLTALIGLILGIVGLRQIQLSEGRLGGQALAISGIAVSGTMLALMLVMVPILAAILFPVFAQAREKARTTVCMSHMKQLGAAMRMYVEDHDGYYSRKENWCDALMPYAKNPEVYQCPSLPGQRGAYAYNAQVSRISAARVMSPATTIAAFDATGGWNLAGGIELANPRHSRGLNGLFADGHVRWMRSLDSVKWRPGP